jgi:hypothetical protein
VPCGRLGTLVSWKQRASCKGREDLDWFGFTIDTIRVCSGCPVRMDCLFEGLAEEESSGTWGMTSEAQRRRLRAGKATVEEIWDANMREAGMWTAVEDTRDVPDALQAGSEVRLVRATQGRFAF